MALSWKDFKAQVDAEIKKAGADENVEIDWIDTGVLFNPGDVEVSIDIETNSITITGM